MKIKSMLVLCFVCCSLSAVIGGSAMAQDVIEEYGPAIRGAAAANADGEFWFVDLLPGYRANIDWLLEIKGAEGESESASRGEDLLIVNNGDGSDFFFPGSGIPPLNHISVGLPRPMLIGLLLPAVQKVRDR